MHFTEKIDFDRCVVVDFESYYDDELSITEMGYTRYIQNTHVYMVSVVNDSIQWVGDPEEFDWDLIEGYDFIAHNAAFDQHICDLRGWGKYRDFFCTADLCAFLQAPRNLAGAAKRLLNRSLNKKVRSGAKGRRWPEDFDAQQRKDMLAYALSDSVNSWDIFKKHIHEWPLFERKLSRITRIMGWRGVTVIKEELEEAIETLKRAKHEKLTSLPWYGETDPSTGKPYADMSDKALVYYCLKEGVKPPSSRAKDSVEAQAWVAKHGERLPWIQAMQDIGSINGQLTKVQAMLNRTVEAETSEEGHRMPYALKYYGAATTGRWSGDGGFNTQNITKGRHFGIDLRSLIRCLPGNALGIIDLSNIEPRCLYYLSGDHKPLELIRQGLDIYEAHARLTMGYDSDKPLKRPNDDPEQKKWSKFRDLAKVRVLQLGYGSGWHKLYLSARKYDQLHVFEEPYTAEERAEFISFVTKYNQKLVSELKKATAEDMLHYINAFRQVMDFRAKSPKITGFWSRMNDMLQEALGEDLVVTLPSGRDMRYFNVRMGADGIECQTERGGNFYKFYGSKLVENCLSYDTEVLSETRGWVPLGSVQTDERVHDGVEFVSHAGVARKGVQQVIDCHGVLATPDHEFLTVYGWKPAEFACGLSAGELTSVHEASGLHRTKERGAYRAQARRFITRTQQKFVESALRLWEGCLENIERFKAEPRWLQPCLPSFSCEHFADSAGPRQVQAPNVRGLARDGRPLPTGNAPCVPQLRREGDSGLRVLARVFSKFLGRHAPDMEARVGVGPHRQREGVFARQLSVDFKAGECTQPPGPETPRQPDSGRGRFWVGSLDGVEARSSRGRPLDSGHLPQRGSYQETEVFDLLDCGPRSRFAVRPSGGGPAFIAHNCTQGIARDVFATALLRVVEAGIIPVLQVHDELVIEWEVSKIAAVNKMVEDIFSTTPEWLGKTPLSSESQVSEHYTK